MAESRIQVRRIYSGATSLLVSSLGGGVSMFGCVVKSKIGVKHIEILSLGQSGF